MIYMAVLFRSVLGFLLLSFVCCLHRPFGCLLLHSEPLAAMYEDLGILSSPCDFHAALISGADTLFVSLRLDTCGCIYRLSSSVYSELRFPTPLRFGACRLLDFSVVSHSPLSVTFFLCRVAQRWNTPKFYTDLQCGRSRIKS